MHDTDQCITSTDGTTIGLDLNGELTRNMPTNEVFFFHWLFLIFILMIYFECDILIRLSGLIPVKVEKSF